MRVRLCVFVVAVCKALCEACADLRRLDYSAVCACVHCYLWVTVGLES